MPLSLRERQLALLVALVRQRQRRQAEAAAPGGAAATPAAAAQGAGEVQRLDAGLQAAHEQLRYYKEKLALLQAHCADAAPSPVPLCQPLALWLEGRDADSPAETVRSGLSLLGGLLLVEPSRDGAELALWNEPSGAIAAIARVTQRVLASAATAQPAPARGAAQEAALVFATRLCSTLSAPSGRLRSGSAARSGWLVAAQRCLELLGADPRIGERVMQLLGRGILGLVKELLVANGGDRARRAAADRQVLDSQPVLGAAQRVLEAHRSLAGAEWRGLLQAAFDMTLSHQIVHTWPLLAHQIWQLSLLAAASPEAAAPGMGGSGGGGMNVSGASGVTRRYHRWPGRGRISRSPIHMGGGTVG